MVRRYHGVGARPLGNSVLILTVLGYGLATLYYLESSERLKANLRRQLLGVMGLILLIIIVFSDWQDKTV
jgi:hypothetical protein